jgi:signal transduction histidine kinase
MGQLIDYRGKKVLAAWRHLNSLNWGMVAKIDIDEAFADVTKLKNLIIITMLIIFVLVSMSAFYIAHSISDPIKKLSKGAEIVGSGNLDYKVGTKLKDEIGQLSRAFDNMSHNLKEITALRKDAQIELERSKRLSDIGVLAATVAHELRNPLAAINISASIIKRKNTDGQIQQQLSNIEKSITESNQIINNLLYYSRIRPPKPEKVNIADLLEECIGITQQKIKKDIFVQKDTDAIKDIFIEADPLQIREVFNNILDNACDGVTGTDGRIDILGSDAGEQINISINDNGTGIEAEDLKKVFDPFFTTKAKGTGLGLSLCRQIIDLHGGTINIESEPNKGTSVTITLPNKHSK